MYGNLCFQKPRDIANYRPISLSVREHVSRCTKQKAVRFGPMIRHMKKHRFINKSWVQNILLICEALPPTLWAFWAPRGPWGPGASLLTSLLDDSGARCRGGKDAVRTFSLRPYFIYIYERGPRVGGPTMMGGPGGPRVGGKISNTLDRRRTGGLHY